MKKLRPHQLQQKLQVAQKNFKIKLKDLSPEELDHAEKIYMGIMTKDGNKPRPSFGINLGGTPYGAKLHVTTTIERFNKSVIALREAIHDHVVTKLTGEPKPDPNGNITYFLTEGALMFRQDAYFVMAYNAYRREKYHALALSPEHAARTLQQEANTATSKIPQA